MGCVFNSDGKTRRRQLKMNALCLDEFCCFDCAFRPICDGWSN